MWELQQCLDARVEKDEKSLQQLQIVIYECTWENLTYSTSIYAVCVHCTSLWRGSGDAERALHLCRFPRINAAIVRLDGDGEGRACKRQHIGSNELYSRNIRHRQQTSEKLRWDQKGSFKHRLAFKPTYTIIRHSGPWGKTVDVSLRGENIVQPSDDKYCFKVTVCGFSDMLKSTSRKRQHCSSSRW